MDNMHPVTVATRIEKPWGYEVLWAHSAFYAGKILHVDEGQSLSRQYHEQKDEWQYVLSGSVRIEVGDGPGMQAYTLLPGQGIHLPAGVIHRVHAVASSDILEASTPQLDDVVRLEDRYGRAGIGATVGSVSDASPVGSSIGKR